MIVSNIENFSSMSTTNAKVEIYSGSTLVKTCTCSDVLSDFSITREGDAAKFFGFGICHNLSMVLIDLEDAIHIEPNYTIQVGLGDLETDTWDYPYPTFYINELSNNAKEKTITVKAADKISDLNIYTLNDLHLTAPYKAGDIADAIATKYLNTTVVFQNAEFLHRDLTGNLEGTEKLRDLLNAIAEITQTIYFINYQNQLVFKRLNKDVTIPDTSANADNYYELNVLTPKTLTAICSATELGNNLTAGTDGITQYIRNNPFLDTKTDAEVSALLEDAIAAVGGLTIYQYDLDWFGDYRLEIGDLIELVTDSKTVYSYNLSDSITYAGTFNQIHRWSYTQTDESASNPATIKDAIDRTYARVDKMEKEIILYVGEVVDTVVADRIDTAIDESIDGFNDKFNQLQNSVDAVNGRIDTVTEDIEGLQSVQYSHTERFAKIELDTQSIHQEVNSLTETTEVLENDISVAQEEAFKKAEDEAAEALRTAKGLITESEGKAHEYTDSQITVVDQKIDSKVAEITVTTDGIKQQLATNQETLLTKFDDYYTKTEVYTQKETDSKIEIAKDAITLEVSNTYETKTSVASQISEVKTYAEQQATQSETASKEYTDQQVGLTVEEVNKYADGAAADAESNAKDYSDQQLTIKTTTLEEKISGLEITDSNINASVAELNEHIVTVEDSVGDVIQEQKTIQENIGNLEVESDNITAKVSSLEQKTYTDIQGTNDRIDSLERETSLKVDAEGVEIAIEKKLSEGVDKVVTAAKKYTFDDTGLSVSSKGSNISTTITEDGMRIYRAGTEVLTADNEGVKAEDLHATTYLIIGNTSRLEDRGNRTACFWIGDNDG